MLGTRIAALRRQAGMSQRELAAALAVGPSAIGMYEQGRREPSADRLVALSRLFGVSTDYLLTGQPHAGDAAAMLRSRRLVVEGQITLLCADGVRRTFSGEALAALLRGH